MAADSPRRWEIVYNAIVDAINQGKLGPGDHIPAERELVAEHKVTRTTVRTALARLREEGRITGGAPPLPPKVRDYRPLYWNLSRFELGDRRDDPDHGVDEWAIDMVDQGRVPKQDITVSQHQAPSDIAAHLQLPAGTWLVRRRRLRYADDEPVSIADTWLPPDVAERTCTVTDPDNPDATLTVAPFLEEKDVVLPGGIVAAIGIRQVIADDLIRVRMPTHDEAKLLRIVGTDWYPVGEHIRVGIDDTGRRVRALISVFPGHRLYLRYQLHYLNQRENT